MWRWVALAAGLPGVLWLLWGVATAEGESVRLSAAYSGLFGNALRDYLNADPSAPARSGFQTTDAPVSPCDPLSALYRRDIHRCRAVSVEVSRTPTWLAPVLPLRTTIRISPGVWADPAARSLLLNLARNKPAACAAVDAGDWKYIAPERYGLGCDARQPPPHEIWFNITSAPAMACFQTSRGTDCRGLKVDDSRAFRVSWRRPGKRTH
jgi:hypothetical protein